MRQGRSTVKSATVVIKKYGNRRLYDTSGSRYINLDEIAAMIRNGNDVKVVDAKTGEDLTRLTLTQIIVEEAKDQPSALPLDFLRQLVLASDKVSRDFMSWYLKSAFDSYRNLQNAVHDRVSQVGSVAFSPLETLGKIFSPGESRPPEPAKQEVEELRERISQLEAQLKKKQQRKPAKKK
jgi:polyhydroxyalkanoate synthesis repressor PhaR